MTPVDGKDVSIYVRRGTDWVNTVCAISCRMEFSQEMIPVATKDSGRENDYVSGFEDCTISLEGVMTLDELPFYQAEDFLDSPYTKRRILMLFTNSWGDRLSYDMNVLVESYSNAGETDDFAIYNVSMKRCGAWTKQKVFNAILDSDGNPVLDSNGYPIR